MIIGEERIYTNYDERCEICKHYKFFDSAYGSCRFNPPKEKTIMEVRFDFTFPFFHIDERTESRYPLVPWDMITCGQFDKKQGKEK